MVIKISNNENASNFAQILRYFYAKYEDYSDDGSMNIIEKFCRDNDICFIDDYGISYKNESIICYPCLDEFEFNLEYMTSLHMLLDSEEEPEDYIIYWPSYDEDMLIENKKFWDFSQEIFQMF